MPTTVRKENRCTIEDSGAVAKAISNRSERKRNAKVSTKEVMYHGSYRRLFVHWQGTGATSSSGIADTPDYKRSQRERYKVEALFAELKQQIKLRRVRYDDCGMSLSSSIWQRQRKT